MVSLPLGAGPAPPPPPMGEPLLSSPRLIISWCTIKCGNLWVCLRTGISNVNHNTDNN